MRPILLDFEPLASPATAFPFEVPVTIPLGDGYFVTVETEDVTISGADIWHYDHYLFCKLYRLVGQTITYVDMVEPLFGQQWHSQSSGRVTGVGSPNVQAWYPAGSHGAVVALSLFVTDLVGEGNALFTYPTAFLFAIQRDGNTLQVGGAAQLYTEQFDSELGSFTTEVADVGSFETSVFGYMAMVMVSDTLGAFITMVEGRSGEWSALMAKAFTIDGIAISLGNQFHLIDVMPNDNEQSPACARSLGDGRQFALLAHDWAYAAGEPAKLLRVSVGPDLDVLGIPVPTQEQRLELDFRVSEYCYGGEVEPGSVAFVGLLQTPGGPRHGYRWDDADAIAFSATLVNGDLQLSPTLQLPNGSFPVPDDGFSGLVYPAQCAPGRKLVLASDILPRGADPYYDVNWMVVQFPELGMPVVTNTLTGFGDVGNWSMFFTIVTPEYGVFVQRLDNGVGSHLRMDLLQLDSVAAYVNLLTGRKGPGYYSVGKPPRLR